MKDAKEDVKLMGSLDDIKFLRYTCIMSDNSTVSERSYDEQINGDALTRRVEVFLENYNIESKKPINITMFEFAMDQTVRISRILR